MIDRCFSCRCVPILMPANIAHTTWQCVCDCGVASHMALNGIELEYTQQELIDVILSVASGNTDTSSLLEWILNHEASEAR